jgi:hypothetical protein
MNDSAAVVLHDTGPRDPKEALIAGDGASLKQLDQPRESSLQEA